MITPLLTPGEADGPVEDDTAVQPISWDVCSPAIATRSATTLPNTGRAGGVSMLRGELA